MTRGAAARALGALFALFALGACGKGGAPGAGGAATDAADAGGPDLAALARAEDQRRAGDIPEAMRASHDAAVRRRVARALARIADAPSADALLAMLSDEDARTVAWAAYGLGRACRGREEAHVKALVARAASLGAPAEAAADTRSARAAGDAARGGSAPRGENELDPRTAIVRAVGRCNAPASEPVLAAWVRARGAWAEPAVYALGDVAARRGGLAEETLGSLLDAAEGAGEGAPLDAAIYPIGRIERAPEALAPRVLAAARAILARPGPARIFAVRALGRTTKDAAGELARVASDRAFTVAERAEAARALGLLGADGQGGIADVLARVVPDKDPVAIAALAGDEFGPLAALVAALGPEPPKRAEPALYALARIEAPTSSQAKNAPSGVSEPLARRLAELRCGASLALAKGAFDAEVLTGCAPEGSEAWEKARLAAIARRPIAGERRAAWKALARSKNLRVREDAVEAFGAHPELGDAGRAALAEALASKQAGLVATAASVVQAHPDRVMVLAERERRAALDPSAPPPTANPARDVDPLVARALDGALAYAWPEDLVETRANLVDAAVAVRAPGALAAARAACADANVTMRERAVKALRALGEGSSACAPPEPPPAPAAELAAPLASPVRVAFQTDAGEVAIRFDEGLAPVSAARFVALARAGFFRGIVVHRVVPGFVVQFGDPGGDGYGGAGKLLRDEASPVAFGPLDVGVALAGRDTGSSQLFVTLARYPHLDGEYARVGRAEGDWAALAQGDVVRDVKVE